ncbi:MAG TPA: glycosyltransferase family 4 protein [Acidimicrobiales bacterium]|nr:glycosyltransferase family 4 protein [Acidimicrobiales bacterium]
MRSPHVHLIEPGGRGGVHHHTVALAAALAAEGLAVDLHTAADAEPLPLDLGPVRRRHCLWHFPRVPRPLRRVAVVIGWLVLGVPSCLARVRPGDVTHVQGLFRPGLLVPLMVGLRTRRCIVAFSPHNTFSRRGRAGEERLLRWLARRADVVVTFSTPDRDRVETWGARAVRAPFPVLASAHPPAELVAAWRRRWGADVNGPVVLLPGYLRPDKGLDVAIRAAAGWGDGALLAVVGQDAGALEAGRRLAHALGVRVQWDEGYRPLEEFMAAVVASDVVVCPYRAASQSAVLALARAVGRPTVASAVGGLRELATVVVPPDDPAALAEGVRRALTGPPPDPVPDHAATVTEAYVSLYRSVEGREWVP